MASATLNATARTGTGKGAARKLRQQGFIPGVIYGHGRDPQPLSINTRDVDQLLGSISVSSTVIDVSFGGATSRTLIREIQRHPFKRQILHIDFQELVAGERVTVRVPLVFIGIPEGVRTAGGILEQIMHEVELRVDPSNIPNHIDVDVTPLPIGHSVHVSDLKLPEGVEILEDEDATVCAVGAPKAVVEPVVAEVAEVAEVVAEPELIRKKKAEEESEEK
jgi:large subunit ribosomal protein L25